MTDKKKYVGFYLSLETIKRLRIFAAKCFKSLSELVEEAIKEYLDKRD